MRILHRIFRSPRPAAIFAAAVAVMVLGTLASLSSTPSAAQAGPAPTVTAAAVLPGDDNRDGIVDEDESGWDCRTMGNRQCGPIAEPLPTGVAIAAPIECEHNDAPQDVFRLCLTVAAQPAYEWTNPDGSKVGNPDGRALIRDLEEQPGTPEWADALRALDAEYRANR
ncbi:hypothetical protein [Streptomyces sp. NPDC000880]